MIHFGVGLSGMITLQRVKADTGLIVQEMTFPNLIVDDGLDGLGTATPIDLSDYCAVGTSNTAPATTQTALGSEIARTSTITTTTYDNSGSSPWNHTVTRTYTFAVGAATGTLAEIGFFNGPAPGTMFSRALVTDGGGTPTTITILSDESLYVTYTLYKWPSTESLQEGTVVINSVTYDWDILPSNLGSTSTQSYWRLSEALWTHLGHAFETNTLGAITGTPAGTSSQCSTGDSSMAAYTPGTYYRDGTIIWTPTVGNFASGIGAVTLGTDAGFVNPFWQIGFTPKIPKTSDDQFELTIRYSWARHT